jgi:transcription termination factor Rho
MDLFSDEEIAVEPSVPEVIAETAVEVASEKKVGKVIKFNKSAYEKKVALQKEKEEAKEAVAENESDSVAETVENSETPENTEVSVPAKKLNPNQLQKQEKQF